MLPQEAEVCTTSTNLGGIQSGLHTTCMKFGVVAHTFEASRPNAHSAKLFDEPGLGTTRRRP